VCATEPDNFEASSAGSLLEITRRNFSQGPGGLLGGGTAPSSGGWGNARDSKNSQQQKENLKRTQRFHAKRRLERTAGPEQAFQRPVLVPIKGTIPDTLSMESLKGASPLGHEEIRVERNALDDGIPTLHRFLRFLGPPRVPLHGEDDPPALAPERLKELPGLHMHRLDLTVRPVEVRLGFLLMKIHNNLAVNSFVWVLYPGPRFPVPLHISYPEFLDFRYRD
jgi:hypothetical protein